MKLKFLLLFALAAFTSAVIAAPLAAGLGIHAALASGLLLGGTALGSASSTMSGITLNATTITTTLLDSTFGAHFADGSKSNKDLHTKLFQGSEFDSLFKLQYTKLSVYDQGLVSSSEITQPYQKAFTPNGTFTFTPSRSDLQGVKVDLQPSSYDVWDKWIGWLHEQGKSQLEQPFVVYLLNNIVVPQHIEDMELKVCYKGVRAEPTPGTAGAAADSLDGVRFKLNAGVTATTITPISTGAIETDPADFVTQIEDFVDGIDALDRMQNMSLAMDDALARRFRRGMRTKYNSQFLQTADLDRLMDYNNITVKGFQAMAGSSKIFCTPAENAVKAVNIYDQMGARSRFMFEVVDRTVKVWMDYRATYHFIDHSRVYCNEQTV